MFNKNTLNSNKPAATEHELRMFGCSKQELLDLVKDTDNTKMIVMSMLSDAQELMMEFNDYKAANRAINRAKFLTKHRLRETHYL